MKTKEVLVGKDDGIKAKVATELVKKAMKYKSKVEIRYDNRVADGKSLINLIALEVKKGSIITIEATGDDEAAAVHDIAKVLIC